MIRTDEKLKKSVVDHLFWDDSIDSSGIKVEVTNGRALLTGNVPTYRAKDAASDAAWLVPGIRDVDNQLRVQFSSDTPLLADEELQHNAAEVLTWNSDIHGLSIAVSVRKGVVTLEGTVASYWQRNKAENIVSELIGVVEVVNNLVVVPTAYLTDQTIAENVQIAIENSPLVEGQNIKVSVKEGVVTLMGFVTTWHDRIQASNIVANCRGVTDIQNLIEIQLP